MSTLEARDLEQFTGTERWYRHPLVRSVLYTDGVRYMAENGGAHWLIDNIASNQLDPKINRMPLQVWKLRVDRANDNATLELSNGNRRIVRTEAISFTDFPLDELELWVEPSAGEDGRPVKVILLPSEH